MSAEVEVILAVHSDVLLVPVAAVVETEAGVFCWVKGDKEPQKRPIKLGDSNDVFIEVLAGLNEGEEVILNPTSILEEVENEALTTATTTKRERVEGV
jgi:HlyD family secretion protein